MAKRPQLGALRNAARITDATEPAPDLAGVPQEPERDKSTVVSVGLRQSEIDKLGEIAAHAGVTRNNLMGYALRRFLRDYDAGKLNIARDLKTVKRL